MWIPFLVQACKGGAYRSADFDVNSTCVQHRTCLARTLSFLANRRLLSNRQQYKYNLAKACFNTPINHQNDIKQPPQRGSRRCGATGPPRLLRNWPVSPDRKVRCPLQRRETARIRMRGAAQRPRFYVTRAMSASAPGGTVGEQASLPLSLGRRRTPLPALERRRTAAKRVKPTVGGAARCCSHGTGSQDA